MTTLRAQAVAAGRSRAGVISEAALTALESARVAADAAAASASDALASDARTSVGTILAPLDTASLTVAHTDLKESLVVLTDGTVWLAWSGGQVWIVSEDDGWVRQAQVADLAAVGAWIEAH